MLQAYGMFMRQTRGEDHWVGQARNTLNYLVKARPAVTITVDDCRFPNEETMLRALGFVFVRLEPGETVREQSAETAAHESERYWPTFKADLVLSYEKGPRHQAERLLKELESLRA